MTAFEKAEEYVKNIISIAPKMYDGHKKIIMKESYLDGLAEGRKEGYEQGKNNERELQCGKKNYEKDITRLEKENEQLKAQIEKMKLDQKTSFDKGMKHLTKKLKEYDRINGASTDYFEHTVNTVLKWELGRK